MEQPVKFNSIKKFKVIASTADTSPIFRIKKNKEKDFSENLVKVDLGIWF